MQFCFFQGSIKPTLEQRGVNGLFRSIFGPKKLKAELVEERNLLFAIAQCKYYHLLSYAVLKIVRFAF